ncbi:MAG: inosine monophosphate cyclohydrolase, partial [Erysipelotrichia bacterium]|nr:inosine monophosphate cyclohydrolase [Erysipelotrichia bacterium]
MKKNLFKYLQGNEYPGRGICIGISPSGSNAMIAYWIMGRSANSRNRIFEALPDRNGIRTVAADPSKMEDPHLIIYNAVRTTGSTAIVTNGNQTDTIYEYISENRYPGYAFEAALSGRRFEDDAPNYTPRISGIIDLHSGSY